MLKYKMIALDLDGTLNNDEKKITPKTKAALIEAQEQGAVIVLASGRPTPGLLREAEELNLKDYHGLLLAYNGGQVVDVTSNEVLYEKAIPNELAKRLLSSLEQYPVTPIVDDAHRIYTNTPDGFQVEYEATNNNLTIEHVDNIAASVNFNPVKVLIASPEEKLQPVVEAIEQPFTEELSFILSTPFYLEATMKGIDKAKSLNTICEKLNIKQEEVMAFGDGENDMTMLRFAGLGVAMDNAREVVKDIADHITHSNNEDGIAHVLAQHFDNIEV